MLKSPLLCLQRGDRGLLPVPPPAANAGRAEPVHDAEPLRWSGEEAGHAALPQHKQLPEQHLPVHTPLQALNQRKKHRTSPYTCMYRLLKSSTDLFVHLESFRVLQQTLIPLTCVSAHPLCVLEPRE